MYGQKHIIQCLAVALILAVFNFHRAAIKRSKSIPKPKIRRPGEPRTKIRPIDNDNLTTFNQNITGYCIRYPFGPNMYGNHDADYICHNICFDQFGTWLRHQCASNCCVHKNVTINSRQIDVQNRTAIQPKRTRNCKNALMEYIENGAGLQNNNRCEPRKTIIEPINENLMSTDNNQTTEQYQCKIQTKDQLICKNTTSVNHHHTKLETNKSQFIMEYHDFLFDMGISEPKPKSLPSNDQGSVTSFIFGMASFVVIIITIRCIFKIFMTDHAETFLRAMELRREIQVRMERMNAEMMEREDRTQATANAADNSNSPNDDKSQDESKSEPGNPTAGDEIKERPEVTDKQSTLDDVE